MTDSTSVFQTLRRPKLLIRAARITAAGYRRDRDLSRLMALRGEGSTDARVRRLLSIEADLDDTRRKGDATYSITRHVEVLAALMAEVAMTMRAGRA
jgi:hypothetical protein